MADSQLSRLSFLAFGFYAWAVSLILPFKQKVFHYAAAAPRLPYRTFLLRPQRE